MIVITGAAGFIGSCMAAFLAEQGYKDLVLVDDFAIEPKRRNWTGKAYRETVHRDHFLHWLAQHERTVEAVIHLGARTDTAEQDIALFDRLNLNYSKAVWLACTQYQIPLIYASSAATYGGGEHGYSDEDDTTARLHPLNPYARSKHHFDQWVLAQPEGTEHRPFFWAGLKFFNVYGPNEYHKGRMASVIFHAFHQIQQTGKMKLFRSHREGYANGGQMRDFVYVKDICQEIFWLLTERPASGIYNAGSGQARTFQALAEGVFDALGKSREIAFIDMPLDIRDSYQYYTQAETAKLHRVGYQHTPHSLEVGISDYVGNYLQPDRIW